MKKYIAIAFLILATVFTAAAQTETDEQTIRKMISDYDQAIGKNDTSFFERTLSDDYFMSGPYAEVETKADALKWAQKSPYRDSMSKAENVRVRVVGNMAVATADWTTTRVMKDDKLAVPHTDFGRFTVILEKRDGQWKIVAEHVSEKGHDRKEMEQQILKTGQEYAQMIKNNDVAAIDRVLADDFTYTDEHGKVRTKAQNLAGYKENGDSKLESIEVTDQKVRITGNGSAVETGTVNYKGVRKGKQVSGSERYTTTWVWRDQRWQIIADHISKTGK